MKRLGLKGSRVSGFRAGPWRKPDEAQAGSTLFAVRAEGLSVVGLGGPKMKSSLWLYQDYVGNNRT